MSDTVTKKEELERARLTADELARIANDALARIAFNVIRDGVVENDAIILLHNWLNVCGVPKSGPLRKLRDLIDTICEDMVVTKAERKELLRFLKVCAADMSPEAKGRAFEEFVITRFDNREYRLIEWRSDKFITGWGGPESSKWPDIVMEHIASKERFAIECKFRMNFDGYRLEWTHPEQLQRYRDYAAQERTPVFIAIGLGGEASAPHSLFIMKLKSMNYADVTPGYLEKFRFPSHVTGLDFG